MPVPELLQPKPDIIGRIRGSFVADRHGHRPAPMRPAHNRWLAGGPLRETHSLAAGLDRKYRCTLELFHV